MRGNFVTAEGQMDFTADSNRSFIDALWFIYRPTALFKDSAPVRQSFVDVRNDSCSSIISSWSREFRMTEIWSSIIPSWSGEFGITDIWSSIIPSWSGEFRMTDICPSIIPSWSGEFRTTDICASPDSDMPHHVLSTEVFGSPGIAVSGEILQTESVIRSQEFNRVEGLPAGAKVVVIVCAVLLFAASACVLFVVYIRNLRAMDIPEPEEDVFPNEQGIEGETNDSQGEEL
jgi:hypothetical protein